MSSRWWHHVQFATFLAAGLLFWWPVIQPWQKARWSRWFIPVYLFLATLPCDALSAYLTFCDYVVYASYLDSSHAVEATALQDQQFAGALMWVAITFIYMVPAVTVTLQILSPRPAGSGTCTTSLTLSTGGAIILCVDEAIPSSTSCQGGSLGGRSTTFSGARND